MPHQKFLQLFGDIINLVSCLYKQQHPNKKREEQKGEDRRKRNKKINLTHYPSCTMHKQNHIA